MSKWSIAILFISKQNGETPPPPLVEPLEGMFASVLLLMQRALPTPAAPTQSFLLAADGLFALHQVRMALDDTKFVGIWDNQRPTTNAPSIHNGTWRR